MVFYRPLTTRIRRPFLEKEFARTNVPIFEVTYREWKERFYPLTKEDYERPNQFMGVYHNDSDALLLGLPKRFIILNKILPNYEKLMVLYHEIVHHDCVRKGCACARHGFAFRKTELHAELGCIYVSMKRGFPDMTLQLLQEAVTDLENDTFLYIWNATRMVKHPVFHQAVEFVGKPFDHWINHTARHLRDRYQNALVDKSTRPCQWKPSKYLTRFGEGL